MPTLTAIENTANYIIQISFLTNNFHPFQSNPRINASKLKHLIVPPKINLTPSLIYCFCTRSIQLSECHNQPKFDMYVTTGVQKIIAAKNREYRANKNSNIIFKINNFHPFQSNPRINASKLKHTIVPPKINLTPSLICCFCTRNIQLLECHNQPNSI